MDAHRITDAAAALRFMTSPRAYFTLRSTTTGVRFTFKVKEPKDRGNVRFASVMDGDNSYLYMGMIKGGAFMSTTKSKVAMDAVPYQAFKRTYEILAAGRFPTNLEFWHEGRCACCGRRLTVPESIATGIGPECIKKYPQFR